MKYKPKKIIQFPEIEFNRSVRGRYKTSVVNADGSIEKQNDWHKNLILDKGLDKIAYMPWAQVFQFCVAGNVPLVDVVPPDVTDTGLQSPYMMNSFYLEGPSNCGTDIFTTQDDDGNTIKYLKLFRTFDFLQQRENVVVTELGFKESPGASSLFSRVVLDGDTSKGRAEPEVVKAGQFLRVKYEINIQLDPVNESGNGLQPLDQNGNLPTLDWNGSSESGDRHGLQLLGMAGVNEKGVAYALDRGGLCNEPFSCGAVDFGPTWGFVNRWHNGSSVRLSSETKTKTVSVNGSHSLSLNGNQPILVSLSSPLNDYFYINEEVNFDSGAKLTLRKSSKRGDSSLYGILTGLDLTGGEIGSCLEVVGYRQPEMNTGRRIFDMPGPLMALTDYQNFNRFINEHCIRNGESLGSLTVNGESVSMGYSTDPIESTDPPNAGNLALGQSSLTAEQVSGYWPWGDYWSQSQLLKFADVYNLDVKLQTKKSSNVGANELYQLFPNQDYSEEGFISPGYLTSPLTLVMQPVTKYFPGSYHLEGTFDGYSQAVSASMDFDSSLPESANQYWPEEAKTNAGNLVKECFWTLNRSAYFPNFYSSNGSFVKVDEPIVTKSFSASSHKSSFWEPWSVRGASCFLSNNDGLIEPWSGVGNASDRSSLSSSTDRCDFYELPLRVDDYDHSQVGDSRTRTKFCFFDNSVANSIDNGTQIHSGWNMIGVGATTDWSINPSTMSGAAVDNGYIYKFNTPRQKDNEHILKVSFKYNWTRNTGQI